MFTGVLIFIIITIVKYLPPIPLLISPVISQWHDVELHHKQRERYSVGASLFSLHFTHLHTLLNCQAHFALFLFLDNQILIHFLAVEKV